MDISFILKDARSYLNGQRCWVFEVKAPVHASAESIEKAFEAKVVSMYGYFDGEIRIVGHDILIWSYYATV